MTPIYVLLGLFLVLIAIPFGLMLAPLVVGAVLISIGYRRANSALATSAGGAW